MFYIKLNFKIFFLFAVLFLLHPYSIIFSQGTWTQKASLPAQGRRGSSGFSIGNKGYIGCGLNNSGSAMSDFWEWYQSSNTWTQMANIPTARIDGIGFSISTKGYISTGYLNGSTYHNDLWEWDQSTNTWSQKANMPAGANSRATGVGFVIGTNIYIVTGYYNPSVSYYSDMWEWNQATNTWTQKTNFSGTIRAYATGFSIGTKGYLGTGAYLPSSSFYNDFWEWDQSTNTWTQKANFSGSQRFEAVGFSIGNKGFIGTGGTIGTYTNDFWQWDQTTNTWSTIPTLPSSARADVDRGTFVICSKGYICGGWDGGTYFNDLWEYSSNNVSININGPSTICIGSSSTISASGGINYSWSTGATTSSISITPSTTTAYSVTVTESGGCTSILSATVTVNALPTPTISPSTTICSGDAVTLTVTGGNSYSWSNGSSASSIVVSPTSTSSYSVTVTNASGCTKTATTFVTVNNSVSALITGNNLLCSGDSTALIASGGNSFLWSTGATTSSIIVSPANNTGYAVLVSSGSCSDTASVLVTVSPPPNAIISPNTTLCAGENSTLTAWGGGNYLWSNGTTTASIIIAPASTVSYSVIVSIGSCSDTASTTITVVPQTTVNACCNTTITSGNTTTLSASGSGTYSWSNGATASIITVSPTSTTVYYVITTNSWGCSDVDTVIVFVVEPDCGNPEKDLFIPNAFSPNNDGENDVLVISYIKGISCIKNYYLAIFNRWGENIFETEKISDAWDGKLNGKVFDPAVFTYYCKATTLAGQEAIKKGNITLLR
ncbi:MAG: gliding motility-associated C-terminal domain-containing protein [Bacteroidetes bacterium]|nr:gliding motility-associated C-terminal domain-containing protein [Bacteroidota bacterium]